MAGMLHFHQIHRRIRAERAEDHVGDACVGLWKSLDVLQTAQLDPKRQRLTSGIHEGAGNVESRQDLALNDVFQRHVRGRHHGLGMEIEERHIRR